MSFVGLFYLYLCFRVKQLFCDFIQPNWVATGKHKALSGTGGKALLLHAGFHALGTLIITLIFAPMLWWLALVDLVLHSAIDRTKAMITDKTKWPMSSIKYWFVFGLDQEAHNLSHLAYIAYIFITLNPDFTL